MCCTNPENVHCFGTIFPNINFVFAPICAARPVHIQSDQYRSCLTVKHRRAVGTATKNSAVALSLRNDMISINQKVRGRMKAKQRRFKVTPREVTRELRHEWFHVRHYVHDSHWRTRQSFDVYTVSRSHSVVMSVENPAPENSPQSSGELRNGHVANLQELLYQTGSKNGVI